MAAKAMGSQSKRAIALVLGMFMLGVLLLVLQSNVLVLKTSLKSTGRLLKPSVKKKEITLSQMTRSHINDIQCPEPLVPFYDRIVDPLPGDTQKIPRSIHMAWIRGFYQPHDQGRCLSQDMMEIVNLWKGEFPSYSIYFHDDQAVDMLFAQDWPEFPQLDQFMNACVKFGSAMRIDIWRVLILYRYGGIYTDFDIAPKLGKLNESIIQPEYSALFSSDVVNRPSQWLQAMEKNHPIAYFTMLTIFNNLRKLNDVSTVPVVFTTGPGALKTAYTLCMYGEESKTIFDHGLHKIRFGKGPIRKLPYDYTFQNKNDRVPYPRNAANPTLIKKAKRIQKEMNTTHWTVFLKQTRHTKPTGSCLEHLYINAQNLTAYSVGTMLNQW